jgi:hypothetical protein
MHLARVAVVLALVLTACGSSDEPSTPPDAGEQRPMVDAAPPPTGPRVFGELDAEPGDLKVRGDHLYWVDTYSWQRRVEMHRIRRSPVGSFTPETLFETEDYVGSWDVSSTHVWVVLNAGATIRIPLAGGSAESVRHLGNGGWALAGDRVLATRRGERELELIDVTGPGEPTVIARPFGTDATVIAGDPSRVLLSVTRSDRSDLVVYTVPAGISHHVASNPAPGVRALHGPDAFWSRASESASEGYFDLMRGNDRVVTLPGWIESVAFQGDAIYVVQGPTAYHSLSRIDPPTTEGGPPIVVDLHRALSHGTIAADEQRVFWVERDESARKTYLMVDDT